MIITRVARYSRTRKSEREEPNMQSHQVDYEIFGDDMQIVEIELDPGETVIAEAA